jgi:hypothetical protein
MTWLPTWDDARLILRSLRVSDQEIVDYLHQQRAIESGSERFALYELIALALRTKTASNASASH